jgi:predicted ester cyclase
MTAEQGVDFYRKCWGHFNARAWDAFQSCYTADASSESIDFGEPSAKGRAAIIEAAKAELAPNPDARGELQLVLANGAHIVGLALWKGTHTAPMPGPDGQPIPATGKKFGFLMANTVELDADRTGVQAEANYVEIGTLLGQLGLSKAPVRAVAETGAASPTVVIAKNDEAEAKNVAAVQAQLAAFNKHDLAAADAAVAGNYVLHEIATPADTNKKQSLASLKDLFKAFSDVRLTPSLVYGAGDYVVVQGTFDGTNDGPMPALGLKKGTGKSVKSQFIEVFRFENGKVAEDWLFYNGASFAGQLGLS